MAKFKLYLLNIVSSTNLSSAIGVTRVPISEFEIVSNQHEDNLLTYWDQTETDNISKLRYTTHVNHNPYFCYSQDEKFELHQNTQRTLTFTMARDIIREDRIEKNPFINYLYIGAQLLLEDKYSNHHLMTVNKISYEFHQLNTVFKYECLDSFNYQLSRQNSGYEIINNLNDVNFIGAKTFDWWVRCKIQPECNISYEYLHLNQIKSGVKNIAYTKEDYPDFYKTIPFSASGTANSVLISLGEQYGLQLRVYEKFIPDSTNNANNGTIEKYYWFEPHKSFRPSGLKYSPNFNLQSFGMEHIGTSFSSVLNVQSNSIGDELITLIPTVPVFFRTWFETQEWSNSQFATGLFSSACQEKISSWDLEESEIDDALDSASSRPFFANGCIYLPIQQEVVWDSKYDQIKFSTNGGQHSIVQVSQSDEAAVSYNSKYQPWSFGTIELVENGDSDYYLFTALDIPEECAKAEHIYIQLQLPFEGAPTAVFGRIYVSQYRNASPEELEFANIADQIPWLENKLLDFKYFYDHSIINLSQYNSIMHVFENDLRKANAKLLLYSQSYYNALQNKTKILANLSSQLDMIGVTFNADLVKPFQIDGRTKATTNFMLAMSDLFSNKNMEVELLDYHKVLADYINKYFNSEQTFLKNMYLFRKYFYESCNIGKLYSYTWNIPFNTANPDQIKYTFINRIDQYEKLTNTNFERNIFIHTPLEDEEKSIYVPFDKNQIVDIDNYLNYYYIDPTISNFKLIGNTTELQGFSEDAVYYELQWEITTEDTEAFKKVKDLMLDVDNNEYKTLLVTGDKKFRLELLNDETIIHISCNKHCLHTKAWTSGSKIGTDKAIFLQCDRGRVELDLSSHRKYVVTNLAEMRINYFYQTITNKNTILYSKRFIHSRITDNETLISGSNPKEWKYLYTKNGNDYSNNLGLDKQILLYLTNAKNWDRNRIDSHDEANQVYAESFPLTSWYYYGKPNDAEDIDSNSYHNVPFVNIENCISFMRRISVSAQARANWLGWGGLVGGVAVGALGTAIGGPAGGAVGAALGVGLVHGICKLVFTYGDKGFGNDGWSYQDIFGNSDIEAFQNYYGGSSLVYTVNEDYYTAANVSSSDASALGGTEWNLEKANGLLFTFNSYYAKTNSSDKGFASESNSYHYKPTYWRILTENDTITKTDSYRIIALDNYSWISITTDNLTPNQLPLLNNGSHDIYRLDSLVYYPLANLMYSISGSDFNWGENDTRKHATLKELGYEFESGIWLKNKDDSQSSKVIVLKEEAFIYSSFADTISDMTSDPYEDIVSIANATYYDNDTMMTFNLIKECSDMVRDYYITGLQDSDYKQFSDELFTNNSLSETSLSQYEIYDTDHNRQYTKTQLIARYDSYVQIDNSYSFESFSEVTSLKIKCYKNILQDDETYVFDKEVQGTIVLQNNSYWLYTDQKDAIPLMYTAPKVTDFDSWTNAEYWYYYRNSSSPILREKAILIETNLTEYWTNAYYASKNCKYFLPEFWQPAVDQTKNYYSTKIIFPRFTKKNNTTYEFEHLELSSIYVPIVTKLAKEHKFQFRHISDNDDSVEIEQRYGLPVSSFKPLSTIINNNSVVADMIEYLGLGKLQDEWVGVNIQNNFIVYKANEGGRLWSQELQTLSNNAIQDTEFFGGWYDMMIKVLLKCNYINYSPILYKQAKEERDYIWAQLYRQYPHILLEQSYTNKDATTSEQLLQMAKTAFRDYSQVESNYSISVIDPWTLKGYRGQELLIGDGIEVSASEIYDDHNSDIYRSLNQYLYITDISYDLRRDDNIQLTVNSIKYQDKVIGQLIKLIR